MQYRSAEAFAACSAVIGSMTSAMKAQRLLGRQALQVNVKKISPSTGNRGCVYGIEFDCRLMRDVKITLDNAGINVVEFLK